MVEAIEAGFPQREIMDAAYAYQRAVDANEKIVVGVNDFVDDGRAADRDALHRRRRRGPAEGGGRARCGGRGTARRSRRRSAALRQACRDGKNVMPPLVEAVKTYATVGEISDVMREVFATYEEPAVF